VVSADPGQLLRGRVGPVTVRGRGWTSPLGLACRAIEASVQSCDLDMAAVLATRKLRLIEPAEGDAMIALTAPDFGSLLAHPFLRPPQQLYRGEFHTLAFLPHDAAIHPDEGSVKFYVQFAQRTWQCTLTRQPAGNGCIIKVKRTSMDTERDHDEDLESQLSNALTTYFNDLIFELDGTFLSFRDLMVTDKGKEPTCMIAFKIIVKKFPSSKLLF